VAAINSANLAAFCEMRAHPARAASHSAQDQPTIERRVTAFILMLRNALPWKDRRRFLRPQFRPNVSQWPPKIEGIIPACKRTPATRSRQKQMSMFGGNALVRSERRRDPAMKVTTSTKIFTKSDQFGRRGKFDRAPRFDRRTGHDLARRSNPVIDRLEKPPMDLIEDLDSSAELIL